MDWSDEHSKKNHTYYKISKWIRTDYENIISRHQKRRGSLWRNINEHGSKYIRFRECSNAIRAKSNENNAKKEPQKGHLK